MLLAAALVVLVLAATARACTDCGQCNRLGGLICWNGRALCRANMSPAPACVTQPPPPPPPPPPSACLTQHSACLTAYSACVSAKASGVTPGTGNPAAQLSGFSCQCFEDEYSSCAATAFADSSCATDSLAMSSLRSQRTSCDALNMAPGAMPCDCASIFEPIPAPSTLPGVAVPAPTPTPNNSPVLPPFDGGLGGLLNQCTSCTSAARASSSAMCTVPSGFRVCAGFQKLACDAMLSTTPDFAAGDTCRARALAQHPRCVQAFADSACSMACVGCSTSVSSSGVTGKPAFSVDTTTKLPGMCRERCEIAKQSCTRLSAALDKCPAQTPTPQPTPSFGSGSGSPSVVVRTSGSIDGASFADIGDCSSLPRCSATSNSARANPRFADNLASSQGVSQSEIPSDDQVPDDYQERTGGSSSSTSGGGGSSGGGSGSSPYYGYDYGSAVQTAGAALTGIYVAAIVGSICCCLLVIVLPVVIIICVVRSNSNGGSRGGGGGGGTTTMTTTQQTPAGGAVGAGAGYYYAQQPGAAVPVGAPPAATPGTRSRRHSSMRGGGSGASSRSRSRKTSSRSRTTSFVAAPPQQYGMPPQQQQQQQQPSVYTQPQMQPPMQQPQQPQQPQMQATQMGIAAGPAPPQYSTAPPQQPPVGQHMYGAAPGAQPPQPAAPPATTDFTAMSLGDTTEFGR